MADGDGDLDGALPAEAPRALHSPDADQDSVPRADDALLAESHRLLQETQALLASLSNAGASNSEVASSPSPTDASRTQTAHTDPAVTLAERRRATRKAQAAKRRLAYNERQQHEWQSLRRLEGELSDRLTALQQSRAMTKQALHSEVETLSVWKAIATRQLEGRLVAEAQNQRLRRAVMHRAQLIQEQQAMIYQHSRSSKVGLHGDRNQADTTQPPVCLEPEDTALFEAYLLELDTIYAETDDVFRECGVAETPQASYRQDPVRRQDGDLEYFENLDVLLIPFGFEQTCAAMWRSMQTVQRQSGRKQYEGVLDPENTLATKYRIGFERDTGDVVYTMLELVMRRYMEPSRMVLVWRALSEGDGEFAGMHSDETGWCVVRPLTSPDVPMPTVMQTFVRFVPLDFAGGAAGARQSGELGDQFTKLVVDSSEEDGLEVARMMERLLLGPTNAA